MPIVKSSYYPNNVVDTVRNEYSEFQQPEYNYNNNPNNDNYGSYTNTSIEKYDIQDIVYANTTEGITARKIYDKFIRQVPEIVGSCGIDEQFFLNALEDEIVLFTAIGGHKWNFLSVEQNIRLNRQSKSYVLPSNFDQMIAVWIDTNSPLNLTNRKLEILEIDEEKKNFVNGINFYSRKGYQINFLNLNYNTQSCNNCGECNNCNKYQGDIKTHYHIKPKSPKTLDETMQWFPSHPNLLLYFVEKIKEVAYQKAGMPPIINKNLEVLWNDLLRWDMNYMPVRNKLSNDTKLFNFKKVFSNRRYY